MRRIILSVLALVSFITPLSAEVVVFEDSFNGNSLDSSKWKTLSPFSDSTVSVGNGGVNLVARGTIVTKTSFAAPYTLTGSFINQNNTAHSPYSVFLINFRSSGQILSSDPYGNLDGFQITLWPSSASPDPVGLRLLYNQTSLIGLDNFHLNNAGHEYFFSLVDTGDSITFDIDGVRYFTYSSTLSSGTQIGFASRETMQFPGSDYTGDVKINGVQVTSSVPEPSSISLLMLGALGLACRRLLKRSS
jgi:hypothetical protein